MVPPKMTQSCPKPVMQTVKSISARTGFVAEVEVDANACRAGPHHFLLAGHRGGSEITQNLSVPFSPTAAAPSANRHAPTPRSSCVHAVPNPRMRACSTGVFGSCLLLCAPTIGVVRGGGVKNCAPPLESEHESRPLKK